jgi:excinuclease ABC subunit A
VKGFFDWLETKKYKLHVRVFLSKYRGYTLCPDCGGSRLRQEARLIRVSGKTLPDVCAMSAAGAALFFDNQHLSASDMGIAGRLLHEIRSQLKFIGVGLQYHARPPGFDALRGRSPTHTTRHESWSFARGCPLRVG